MAEECEQLRLRVRIAAARRVSVLIFAGLIASPGAFALVDWLGAFGPGPAPD